jgi:hypothetical protein
VSTNSLTDPIPKDGIKSLWAAEAAPLVVVSSPTLLINSKKLLDTFFTNNSYLPLTQRTDETVVICAPELFTLTVSQVSV